MAIAARHARQERFWELFPEAFAFPFHGSGIYSLLAVMIFVYLASKLGVLGYITALGAGYAFVNNIIKHTGFGKKEIPEITEFTDYWTSFVLPWFRGLVATSVIFIPLIFYLRYL